MVAIGHYFVMLSGALEARVRKKYGCNFVDHPTLCLSFVDLLHDGSLCHQMFAFMA